jgi:hypothetical protein
MRLLRAPVAALLTVSLPTWVTGGTIGGVLAMTPTAALAVAPADELTEEQKAEKAKGLYVEAERLAKEGNWEAAVVLYEQAYYLVPGKHGFAHKVGIASWEVKNCDKAYEYLTHFVTYGAAEAKNADKIKEAQGILDQIEATKCRTPEVAPEPEPETEPDQVEEEENPFTEFAEQPGGKPDKGKGKGKGDKQKGGKGLLAGGAVLLTLGVGGIAVGAVGAAMASSAGNTLDDLSSTSTNTGYPIGDYACRDTALECPQTLESSLATGKALTFAGFIGGGVLLVTGVALIAVHVSKNKKKASASASISHGGHGVRLTGLGPTLLPGGGGGASATLRF